MKIAILGYGTIGKGVFEISKFNEKIEVVKILERKEKFDEKYLNLFTQNIDDIINDSEIELVVEVMGGYDFALSCITKALNAKKQFGQNLLLKHLKVVNMSLLLIRKLLQKILIVY